MKDFETLINNGIVAMIPVYKANVGNSTKILTKKSDDVFIHKSIKTIIKILAKYFIFDLELSRKHYGMIIGSTNIVPIPYSYDNIFVPIKTRRTIAKNDGSFSYLNLNYIERIEESNSKIYVVISGGIKVESLQSYKSTEKHIRDGNIVKKIYVEKNKPMVMEESKDFYNQYNQPATKGDIAALRNELLDIKNKLKAKV